MRRRKATVALVEEIRREYEFGIGTIRGVARKFGTHRHLVREGLSTAISVKTFVRTLPKRSRSAHYNRVESTSVNVRLRRPKLDDAVHLIFPAGLVLVLLLAGFVLLYRIGSIPAGFLNAEAANGLLARAADGHGSLLLVQAGTRSPLLAGLIALLGRPLGFDIFSARLAAALAGLATALCTMLWLRRIFGKVWGIAGGLMLAGSFWFILFSRIALSPIAGALALSVLLWCLAEGQARGIRPEALVWYGAAGVAAGIGYVSDPTLRVVPVLLLIALISATHQHGVDIRHNEIAGLLLAILIGFAIAGPFIRHTLATPALLSFWTPTPGLPGTSVTGWSEALRNYGLALVRLVRPLHASLGLNLPGAALLGPFLLPLAMVGLALALRHLRRRLVVTALVGGAILLIPAAAITPVHPGRLLTLLPLLIALPVAGARFLYHKAPSERSRLSVAALTVILLAGNGGWSGWRYFRDWSGSAPTARAFSASVSDALQAIDTIPGNEPVLYSTARYDDVERYLAPGKTSGAHPRIDFNGAKMLPIPLESSGYLVAPRANPVAPALLQVSALPGVAAMSTDRYRVYRVDDRARGQLPLSVPTNTFADGTRFLGHQLTPTTSDKLTIVIAWELPGDGLAHTLRVRLLPVDGAGQTQSVDVSLPGDLLGQPYDLLRLVTLDAPAPGTSADLAVALFDANGKLLTADGIDSDGYLFLNRYSFRR